MRSALAPLVLATLSIPALADDKPPVRPGQNVRRTPIVEAVERAAPAVVSVGTTRIVQAQRWDWFGPQVSQQEQHGLGSGVLVHPSGYVVTNAHVINQADEILVKLTGARETEPDIPATLVAADLSHDLALLRLEKPGPYPYVEFGRSDDLMLGETVIAIGNPFGLGRTVTTGIVSALDRTINLQQASFKGLIQTDAAVNRGNSGGPLMNVLGEWIGVNSSIYSLSGGSDGISFAIPVDEVRRFVIDSLRPARISGTWLGLEFGESPGRGVFVEKVHRLGPAAKAGVVEGSAVRASGDLLRVCFDVLEAAKTGAIRLDLAPPSGKAGVVTVPFAAPPTEQIAWERLGLRVVAVDDAVSRETGLRVGAGLLVTEVRADGPAQRVGLERGDLLVDLGGSQLTKSEDVLDLVLDAERGAALDVRLVRAKRTRLGTNYDRWKARIVVE